MNCCKERDLRYPLQLCLVASAVLACKREIVDEYHHDLAPTPPAEHSRRLALLRKSESFHCTFPQGGFGDYLMLNGPRLHSDSIGLGSFSITEVRLDQSTARILYPEGVQETKSMTTDIGLHFVDTTAAGGIEILTIFADKAPDTDVGAFASAWSGHNQLTSNGGIPFPQQFFGRCSPI
jgi:hypothetical protein